MCMFQSPFCNLNLLLRHSRVWWYWIMRQELRPSARRNTHEGNTLASLLRILIELQTIQHTTSIAFSRSTSGLLESPLVMCSNLIHASARNLRFAWVLPQVSDPPEKIKWWRTTLYFTPPYPVEQALYSCALCSVWCAVQYQHLQTVEDCWPSSYVTLRVF